MILQYTSIIDGLHIASLNVRGLYCGNKRFKIYRHGLKKTKMINSMFALYKSLAVLRILNKVTF